MTMPAKPPSYDPTPWYGFAAIAALALLCLICSGCGEAQDRRDRFAAQVAADVDAQAQAIEQGGDAAQGLANIRTLAHALARAVGYQIDPEARPVYVPALEAKP